MKPSDFVSSLGMWLFQKYFPLVVFAVGLCLSVGLVYAGERLEVPALGVVGGLAFLLTFFLAIFTAREIVERMKEDTSVTLADAALTTWFRYLLLLSFVPIIGPVAERLSTRRKETNPFVENQSNEEEA